MFYWFQQRFFWYPHNSHFKKRSGQASASAKYICLVFTAPKLKEHQWQLSWESCFIFIAFSLPSFMDFCNYFSMCFVRMMMSSLWQIIYQFRVGVMDWLRNLTFLHLFSMVWTMSRQLVILRAKIRTQDYPFREAPLQPAATATLVQRQSKMPSLLIFFYFIFL